MSETLPHRFLSKGKQGNTDEASIRPVTTHSTHETADLKTRVIVRDPPAHPVSPCALAMPD